MKDCEVRRYDKPSNISLITVDNACLRGRSISTIWRSAAKPPRAVRRCYTRILCGAFGCCNALSLGLAFVLDRPVPKRSTVHGCLPAGPSMRSGYSAIIQG